MNSVILVSSQGGTISRTVEAELSPDAGLKISIHDLGEGASMTGDEYECRYLVTTTDLPAFCSEIGISVLDVLADLKANYSGRRFATLRRRLEKSAVVSSSSYF